MRELNVALELWGVAFCVIGIVCVFAFSRFDYRYRGFLAAGFAMELVAAGGDAIAGVFRGQEGTLAAGMVFAGNHLTFIGNFLLLAVLTFYLRSRIQKSSNPAYRTWSYAVTASACIMCALSLFGLFFFIDSSNVYHRTDWHWVSLAYVIVVNAVNTAIVIRNRAGLGRIGTGCLLFYTVVPVIASLVQAFVYGLNFVIIAGVTGLIVLFFEMQQHTSHALEERTEELAAAQVEASESRIAVMVSQIQPHFLFNTLDTIYGLVDEDTEVAKSAIASFSRYLRANLDSLKRTTPVPIEKEIEHVRTYLELERMSDEDRISYTLDIQATDFSVPALSVQTLAENAVKHGLSGHEDGGTVTVRTREQVSEYTVAIVDDGIGFDPDATGEEGVGIANTRERLKSMCGGTLDVMSEPNVGTTVVMHIPKRQPGSFEL